MESAATKAETPATEIVNGDVKMEGEREKSRSSEGEGDAGDVDGEGEGEGYDGADEDEEAEESDDVSAVLLLHYECHCCSLHFLRMWNSLWNRQRGHWTSGRQILIMKMSRTMTILNFPPIRSQRGGRPMQQYSSREHVPPAQTQQRTLALTRSLQAHE